MPVLGAGRGEKVLAGVGIHSVVPGSGVPLVCISLSSTTCGNRDWC